MCERDASLRARVRVKVCGLVRREDVLAADGAGADYVGVVLTDGFARTVALDSVAPLVEGTAARRVAVLVDQDADGAEAGARALGADVLQLHGDEPPELLDELRQRGDWRLWKAVRARALDDVERAVERYADTAEALLIEGWRPGGPGRGGARVALDAEALRRLVPEGTELVLAGGLTPDNVAEAVATFRPDVVDASSGLESSVGAKDTALVRRYVSAVRAAGKRAAGVPPPAGGRGPSPAIPATARRHRRAR